MTTKKILLSEEQKEALVGAILDQLKEAAEYPVHYFLLIAANLKNVAEAMGAKDALYAAMDREMDGWTPEAAQRN